ncbi:uncharacterized protein LTR77_008897 [Saxophila tyrrhenica]|uniref:Major facilitator superfamily (MFS) profile domain-containing protein n=1 Tax=Saxophila tyrrhenica TaxID=1690608 RepID=A0AAV9NZ38_9PEZI|nr:hypothetical protein LTR77_008897 [Saxophila tyrrhenica]
MAKSGSTKGGSWFNFLIIFIVALGSFTYGFNNAITGSVFGLPGFYSYFDLNAGDSSSNSILGAANGVFFAGAMLGCLIAAWCADKLGRVRSLQVVCLLCLVGGILQGASVHVAMLLLGRVVTGLGSGMVNSVVPLYQSEIAPPKIRGLMVGLHGTLLVAGYAMAGWAGYGCYFEPNQQIQWRLLLALQVVTPAMLLVASPFLPESPRWLIANGREELANTILEKLHHSSGDVGDNSLAHREFYQIKQQVELERATPFGLLDFIRIPSYRRRLLVACGTQFIAQSTGTLVVANYQVLLYNGLGLYGSLPLLLYSAYLSWAAFMNYVAALIVDRVGRVRMLAIGFVGCIITLSLFTAMVAEFAESENKVGQGFAVFFLFAFVGFYGGCVDAVSWIYCSEIFPTHARARGFSISVATFLGAALVYTQVAPIAFAQVDWKFYLLFILVTAVGTPIFMHYSPETKGLALEEISELFGDQVAVHLSNGEAESGPMQEKSTQSSEKGLDRQHMESTSASR